MILTFFGESRTDSDPHDHSRINMWGPLVILSVLAISGGYFGLAPVASVLPDGGLSEQNHTSVLAIATMVAPFLGLLVGYLMFGSKQINVEPLVTSAFGNMLRRLWHGGWGFDRIYDIILVKLFKENQSHINLLLLIQVSKI